MKSLTITTIVPQYLVCLLLVTQALNCHGFTHKSSLGTNQHTLLVPPVDRSSLIKLDAKSSPSDGGGLFGAYFVQKSTTATGASSSSRKIGKMSLVKLARLLEQDLIQSQWFVTGEVNTRFVDADFVYQNNQNIANININSINQQHQSPQVCSLEDYCTQVRQLFDQDVTKAEIMATTVNTEISNTITCTWRLSGKLNILWGLEMKPCIVHTDFTIHQRSGLIVRQQDRSDVPQWDLALSAVFPFLNGIFTAPAAPPLETESQSASPLSKKATSTSTSTDKPIEAWVTRAGIMSYFSSSRIDEVRFTATPQIPASQTLAIAQTIELDLPEDEGSLSPELFAYSDMQQVYNIPELSATRTLTPQEMSRMAERANSPLGEIIDFVQATWQGRQRDIPWQAILVQDKVDQDENGDLYEIRAVLSDGTKIPAIQSPTWKHRAQNFLPDSSMTRAKLEEATRRAESRRHARFYHSNVAGNDVMVEDGVAYEYVYYDEAGNEISQEEAAATESNF